MQVSKQPTTPSLAGHLPVVVRRLETFVYRATVNKPVVSTLARITDRVSLLVRVEDQDGAFGWGEIYSSMPSYGAEHRAMVLHRTIAPLLLAQAVSDPAGCWQMLSQKIHAWAFKPANRGRWRQCLAAWIARCGTCLRGVLASRFARCSARRLVRCPRMPAA